MKKALLYIALTSMAFTGSVFAQTCTSPTPYNTPQSGPVASGDTCAASDEVAAYCVFQDSSNKNDVIYQVVLGPTRTATNITITGSGTGFTPSIFLYSDACASANACTQTGEAGSPLDLTTVADGTYLLAVSASQVDGSGACGTYTITANGTLPVELKSFSVM